MAEASPFIPPRPGISPRASPRASAPVIPGTSPVVPGLDPSHYVQPRIGRTPYRYDGLPPQPHGFEYESSPYAYSPHGHRSRSRPSSMYAAATPAMARSNSGGLPPHGPPPGGYWEGYAPPHEALQVPSPYHDGHGHRRTRSYSRPQPPVADFSQPPPHTRPRSHSRGVDDSYLRPVPVPEQFAHLVPPDTQWYNMPGFENAFSSAAHPPAPAPAPAGFGAFSEHAAPYYGYNRPRSRSTHRSDWSTPWRGGGYLPVTPGGVTDALPDSMYDEYGNGFRVARPEKSRMGDIDTRWMTGRGCAYSMFSLVSD